MEKSVKQQKLDKLEELIVNHLQVVMAALVYVVILRILNITCPIRWLIRIPCPGCGTTRALISLIKLNFKDYFYYNAMALPILLVVFLQLHNDVEIPKVNNVKKKRLTNIITIIILVGVILYYIYRLYFKLIP